MALNPHVSFVFIGDHVSTSGFDVHNVRGINISFEGYRKLIQRLVLPLQLQWRAPCLGFHCGTTLPANSRGSNKNNKISDSRPLLGAALASITRHFDWWAWMDIDVVFGDIAFLASSREAFCPLWPNAFHLSTWGAFTAFKRDAVLTSRHPHKSSGDRTNSSSTTGLHPYKLAWQWREAIASPRRQAFEELSIHCGGPTCGLGMSNALNPKHCQRGSARVAEVSACKQRWGPCLHGPTTHVVLASVPATGSPRGSRRNHRASLVTNGGYEVMLLHLFQSKVRWRHVPNVSGWSCVNVTNLMGEGDVRVLRC